MQLIDTLFSCQSISVPSPQLEEAEIVTGNLIKTLVTKSDKDV